jgi:hypothetical protein
VAAFLDLKENLKLPPFIIRFPVIVLALAATVIWLTACASSKRGPVPLETEEPRTNTDSTKPIDFQLIYIVHGDANYSYHDSTGKRHAADSEAVAQAMDVARHSPRSEVFIFHQQPRHAKLFRQTPDGDFYHYRGGFRLHEQAYSRSQDGDFEVEAGLLEKYGARSFSRPLIRFFIYFGHEIPASEGRGYSQSYPERNFSLAEFNRGLGRFRGPASNPEKPFALIVLSTCYGGTLTVMNTLSPHAQFVLASPAYLHLSFLDTRAFEQLPVSSSTPFDADGIHALATDMARQSFERLKENTQTEITVAVYEIQKTVFPRIYSDSRNWNKLAGGYHDCAEDPGFDSVSAASGVEVFYQPPRFGVLKNKLRHSGWECPGK